MTTDERLRQSVRHAEHDYKIHQMKQERIREEAQKRGKSKKTRQAISTAIAYVMVIVWLVAVSALDAAPLEAGLTLVVSTAYLAVYAAVRGWMR